MTIYQKFTYLMCQTRGHFVITQCHSLGRKERKAASPSLHLHAVTVSILHTAINCHVFVAVSRNWYQYFAEKQDCKSMGMQLYETGWGCVTAYCCREELSCFLLDSFSTYFSFSSADSFPPLSPALRHVCPLGSLSSSKLCLPWTVLWHRDQLERNSTPPSITFLKLPAVGGSYTSCLWGMSMMVLQLFLGIVGREVVNLGQNHTGSLK